MSNFNILGVGSALPEKVVTNFDLEKIVETTHDWIVERTGITERRISADNETSSMLAHQAAEQAIQKAGIDPQKITGIIVATATPDLTFPSTACLIQHKLGITNNCFSFDVQAACSGFVYSMFLANKIISSSDQEQHILVVGVDTLSKIVDWQDRSTCVLFGDGAGAAVISNANAEKNGKLLSSDIFSDGSLSHILATNGGTSSTKSSGFISMNGKEVFRVAVHKITDMIKIAAERGGVTVEDIDLIVAHQANIRIIEAAARKNNISMDKFIVTLDKHANTSAASIPLALSQAIAEGKITKGNKILLLAMGAGFTWGYNLLSW